jgi:hypothetical protein
MGSRRQGPRAGRLAAAIGACVCTLALALGIAACGGSKHPHGAVSARAYASSVCKALAPFEREIASRSSALDPAATSSLAQRRTMLEGFLSTIAKDTDKAVAQLRSAGQPEIANGRAIARQFVAAFSRLQHAMDTAARASRRLPTHSQAAFKAAATSLGESVKNSVGGGVLAGLTALRSRTLEAAAGKVAACRSLNS